ncbi:MAG: hypothetical protein PW790_13910, partial [Parvibaculaceae bacterium]|nr:hypothetical protein [Parvibaculaceae bacterium]
MITSPPSEIIVPSVKQGGPLRPISVNQRSGARDQSASMRLTVMRASQAERQEAQQAQGVEIRLADGVDQVSDRLGGECLARARKLPDDRLHGGGSGLNRPAAQVTFAVLRSSAARMSVPRMPRS